MSAIDKNQGNVIVCGLLCLLVALFVLRAPFGASLWVDEALSKWIVSNTIADVIHRAALFQGQSPFYYLLLWVTRRFLGGSEEAMRLLSFVCGTASIVLVYRMTHGLTKDRAAAAISIGALVCCDVFQDALLSARPYAVAIFFATSSVLLLYGLLERFSHERAFLFTLTMIGVWYAHYLFSVIAAAHLFSIARHPTLGRKLIPWSVIGMLVCAPGISQVLALSRRSAELSFASMPNLYRMINGAIPVTVIVSVMVGVLLGLIWGGRFEISDYSRRIIFFLLPYLVIPIAVFGAWSGLSGRSMWVPRYWSWQLPILGMFVGVLLNCVTGARGRTITIVAAMSFFVLRIATQVRVVEDWRGVAQVLNQGDGEIAMYTGLVEAESVSGSSSAELDMYLRVPLLVYGVQRPIHIVGISQREEVIADAIKRSASFVAVTRESFGRSSPQYFTEIAQKNGMEMRSAGNFGGVALYQN